MQYKLFTLKAVYITSCIHYKLHILQAVEIPSYYFSLKSAGAHICVGGGLAATVTLARSGNG